MILIKRGIFIFCTIGIGFILLTGCTEETFVDPFWKIDLEWDRTTMTEKLDEYSKQGEVVNCVFSFEKVAYVKNDNMDARITGSLAYPVFEKDHLKSINYSLIVEFKNDHSLTFNKDFFKFFKNMMTDNYGNHLDEVDENDRIVLNWNVENNKIVKTTILKEINHYIVNIDIID